MVLTSKYFNRCVGSYKLQHFIFSASGRGVVASVLCHCLRFQFDSQHEQTKFLACYDRSPVTR